MVVLILTGLRYMQHFDIIAMEKIVDWFNVMTYDLHGTWYVSSL